MVSITKFEATDPVHAAAQALYDAHRAAEAAIDLIDPRRNPTLDAAKNRAMQDLLDAAERSFKPNDWIHYFSQRLLKEHAKMEKYRGKSESKFFDAQVRSYEYEGLVYSALLGLYPRVD